MQSVKAFNELTNLGEDLCSFLVYVIIGIILVLVIEPEKIKPVAFVLSIVVLGSGRAILPKLSYSSDGFELLEVSLVWTRFQKRVQLLEAG